MTLFRKVEPFPDESLPGLIARAAALNVYPRALDVLVQANTSGLRPEAVALRDPKLAPALAKVLRTTPESIVRMFHPAVKGTTSIDFFGVRLRSKHREPRLRRVSPAALAEGTPYVRAVWHVRPLIFDPGTKQILITHCPECEKALGFIVTKGIATCEHCEFDLRRHASAFVEVEDTDALDYATALIDPGARLPIKGLVSNPLFVRLDRAQLFEMVVALGTALMMNRDVSRRVGWHGYTRGGIQHLDPLQMARASRAIMTWPHGFVDMCRQETDQMHLRDMPHGMVKEFGALALLGQDEMLDGDCKEVIARGIKNYLETTPARLGVSRKAEIRLNPDFVGTKELIEEHGVNQLLVRKLADYKGVLSIQSANSNSAPLLIWRKQAHGIIGRYKDLRSEESIAYELGIPPNAVRDLADRGILQAGDGIENDMLASEANYSRSAFEYLFGFLRESLPVMGKQDGYIPFAEAMLMFPAGRQPWAPLIEDIMMGLVPAVFHRPPTEKALFAAISVPADAVDRGDLVQRQQRFARRDISRVPVIAANLMLGVRKYDVYQACVAAGLLKPDAKNMLAYSELMQFAEDFILTAEIAVRAQRNTKATSAWLRDNGITPELVIPSRGGVYSRPLVEPLLEFALV